MRIIDWSSDVCSSDLEVAEQHIVAAERQRDECGARLDDFQAEQAGEVIGEAGRAHLRNRRVAGRDEEIGGGEVRWEERHVGKGVVFTLRFRWVVEDL